MNSVLNGKVRNFFTYKFSFTVVRGTFSLLALVQACFFQVFLISMSIDTVSRPAKIWDGTTCGMGDCYDKWGFNPFHLRGVVWQI